MDALYIDIFQPESPYHLDESDENVQPWYDKWEFPCEKCRERRGKLCWRCRFVKRKREEEGCIFSPELVPMDSRNNHSSNDTDTRMVQNLGFTKMVFSQSDTSTHCSDLDSSENSSTLSAEKEYPQEHESSTHRRKTRDRGCKGLVRTRYDDSTPGLGHCSCDLERRIGCPMHCSCSLRRSSPEHCIRCSKDHCHSFRCHPNYPCRCQKDYCCDHCRYYWDREAFYCSYCGIDMREPDIRPCEQVIDNWFASRRDKEPPAQIMKDCFRYTFNQRVAIERRPKLVHYGIGLGGISALSYGAGSCSPQPLPSYKPLGDRIWSIVSTSIIRGYEKGAIVLGYNIELRKVLRELD